MSGSGVKCPSCGELAVDWVDYEGQAEDATQQVCTECGFVVEESTLRGQLDSQDQVWLGKDSKPFAHSLPENFVKVNTQSSVPMGTTLARNTVKNLASELKMSQTMEDQAKNILDQALKENSIKRGYTFEKKEGLALACVYIICRQNNWTVTREELVDKIAGCTMKMLNSILKDVSKVTGINVSSPSLVEIIPQWCRKTGVMDAMTIATAQSLVRLFDNLYMTQGCKPATIIQPLVLISLKHNQPGDAQLISSYKKKYVSTQITRTKLREMELMLCSFAEKLPWSMQSKSKVTAKNVHQYVDDILKYQKSLLSDYFREVKTAAAGVNLQVEPYGKYSVVSAEGASASVFKSRPLNHEVMVKNESSLPNLKRKLCKAEPYFEGPQESDSSHKTKIVDNESGVSNMKTMKLEKWEDSDDESGEINLPENAEQDLDQYIRSEKEIKSMLKLTSDIDAFVESSSQK